MTFRLFILLAILATNIQALTLAWTASPNPVDGYVLHWGNDCTNVGNVTQWTLDNTTLPLGTNIFTVTAYNSAGESDPSNALAILNPSSRAILTLEKSSSPSGPWTPALALTNLVYSPAGFYRGVIQIKP